MTDVDHTETRESGTKESGTRDSGTQDSGTQDSGRRWNRTGESRSQQASTEDPAPRRNGTRRKLSHVLREVQAELVELIGRPVEGVSRVERGDSGWTLGIEVLELSKVPHSTDLLASYEVETDRDGTVVGWRRVRRYTRGSQDG